MSICIQNGPEMLVLTSDRFHYEHILFHCFFTRQAEVSNTRYMYIGMPRFYGIWIIYNGFKKYINHNICINDQNHVLE